MKKYQPIHKQKVTLLDRLGVALLSGVTAVITGGLFLLGWFRFSPDVTQLDFAINTLIVFVLVITLLGFFLLENLLVKLFGILWALLSTNG
jgi:hypothetical protein